MLIECKNVDPNQLYHIMIQAIIPRPIAWVLSDNGNDSYNLAPFSFFNGVASNPLLLMISVGHKSEEAKKDTWVNIEERRDFVVHIPSAESTQDVIASSVTLPHGESEVNLLRLKLEKVEGFSLPRLVGPQVAFFCEKYQIYVVGNDEQGLILGEIKGIWLSDEIVQKEKGRLIIEHEKLNPLARLGGSHYALLGKTLTLKRPT